MLNPEYWPALPAPFETQRLPPFITIGPLPTPAFELPLKARVPSFTTYPPITVEALPMMVKVPDPVLVKTEFAAVVLSVATILSILTVLLLSTEIVDGAEMVT
jgi:hypothetical protein